MEYHYPWCRTILSTEPDRRTTGSWIQLEQSSVGYGDYYQIASFELFGCELIAIQDESTLNTKVMDPLLDKLANDSSPTYSE